MNKSQASIDFIIVMTLVLIIFLSLVSIVNQRNTQMYSLRTNLYAKEIADKVATNINTIHLAGYGSTNSFIIPQTLKDTTEYQLKIYPEAHIVDISWYSYETKRHYSSPIITSNVEGNLTLRNIIGSIYVSNKNGVIDIEIETDTTPPVISNVQATSITKNSALITWQTDEDSNSSVYYGTGIESSNLMTISHSIQLTGLEKSTLYRYTVASCDAYENCATSDEYEFTTITPESGSTSNYEFSAGMTYWDFYDWDKQPTDADPTGNWHSSGGDPGAFVSIGIPLGSQDEVGGYWQQSFEVTVDAPEFVNCSFDYSIIAYDPDPLQLNASVYLDNQNGTPSNIVWSNSSIISTSDWSGMKNIDCSSYITTAGTYYYRLALWVETGPDIKGTFRVGYDNAKVEWEE